MRQSLAQLLASSSGGESPREPAASPSEGTSEAGHEETALSGDELLFPPGLGLDLDGWLEAAMTESPEPESPPRPHPPRPSNRLKAAAAARLNRQKKKQYVLGLESRLQSLAAENRHLRDRNRGLCRRLRDLERETGYLRAVLANQSALGRLLSHLAGNGGAGRVGMRISSSLFAQEAPLEARVSWEGGGSDHDYALPVPEEDEGGEENNNSNKRAASPSSTSPSGICLHVDRDQVSVEFCSLCARRAATTGTAASSSSSASFASRM